MKIHLVFDVPDEQADSLMESLAMGGDAEYAAVEILVSDHPNEAFFEIEAAPGPPALEKIEREVQPE